MNCVLIRRAEPVLIDTGPKADAPWSKLLAELDRLGTPPARLRHIVVTHAHIDHHGNLGRLAELSAARIHAHEDDARPIFEHDENMLAKAPELERIMRFWGFPEGVHEVALKVYFKYRVYADSLGRDRLSMIRGDGADLDLGGTRLRAIHCPGHTEGLICLELREGGGILIASDHLLETITPNPTVYVPPYRGRRTGLADYVTSLRRVRDLEVATVVPGHGRTFPGLGARVDAILLHHEHRKEKIRAILAGGSLSVLEIVLRLWERLKPADYYLACREVEGHLELLETEGVVRRETDAGGTGRFSQ